MDLKPLTRKQIGGIVSGIIKDKEIKKQYFESDGFNTLFEIIKKHKVVDQERLMYGQQVIEGLSHEQFQKVFEAVYEGLELKVQQDESSKVFPKHYVDYQGIRFNLLIGQGSTYWTTKID